MKTILIRPIITEKSMKDAGSSSKFTFHVALAATKDGIRKLVEDTFKVHVKAVSITRTKGKTMRVGKRRVVKQLQDFKKATVTLTKGEKIDLFEVGGKN